jgi:hypothetical protein
MRRGLFCAAYVLEGRNAAGGRELHAGLRSRKYPVDCNQCSDAGLGLDCDQSMERTCGCADVDCDGAASRNTHPAAADDFARDPATRYRELIEAYTRTPVIPSRCPMAMKAGAIHGEQQPDRICDAIRFNPEAGDFTVTLYRPPNAQQRSQGQTTPIQESITVSQEDIRRNISKEGGGTVDNNRERTGALWPTVIEAGFAELYGRDTQGRVNLDRGYEYAPYGLTALGPINMPQFFRQQVGWAEKPSMMLDEDAGLFSPAYFTDRIWRLMAKSLEQALRRLRLTHLFW